MKRRPITGDIRKIQLYYYPHYAELRGIRFFNADGKMIYESACKRVFIDSYVEQHEILLNEGERIIGFQFRSDLPIWFNEMV